MATRWRLAANNNLLSHFDLIDLPLTRRVAGAQIPRIVVTTRDLSVAGMEMHRETEGGKGRKWEETLLQAC